MCKMLIKKGGETLTYTHVIPNLYDSCWTQRRYPAEYYTEKYDFLPQYICHVFLYKYLQILELRCVYLTPKMS